MAAKSFALSEVPAKDRSAVVLLLEDLDEAFDRKSWHGPNLLGSVRGVSLDQAAWRPAADRRNIWEQVLHAAYWKYVVRRRLTGASRGSFPLPGSNLRKWGSATHLIRGAAAHDVYHAGQIRLLRRLWPET